MKMLKMKLKLSLWVLLFGISVTFTAAAGAGSCVGRCGEVFARGQRCTCDVRCLRHNECCQDFEAICTTAQSCRGRCAETFRRGRLCECDSQCVNYNTCCRDYKLQCDVSEPVSSSGSFHPVKTTASGKRQSQRLRDSSNSESEEWYRVKRPCPQSHGPGCQGPLVGLRPLTDRAPGPVTGPTHPQQAGVSNVPLTQRLASGPSLSDGAPDFPGQGSSLLSHSAPSTGSSAPHGATDGNLNLQVVLSHGEAAPTNQGVSAAGFRPKPNLLQDAAQASGAFVLEGPVAGVVIESDLCSDSPINGLTALSNGTVLIFKGEVFWSVDPVSRLVGRPQSITATLGISAPIDTVFTRCNCHGNTYIIKGDQYWRLDGNMVMEPGFPKPLVSEFPGLSGGIRAVLAVPATSSRQETVYFFKNGDIMQKFTFSSESTLTCSKTPNSMKRRSNRQADGHLSREINIKVSLKEIPTPVTSALSIPNLQRTDRYEYYTFSGPLFFSINISGDLMTLAKPDPLAVLMAPPIPSSAAMGTNYATSAQNAKPPHPANSIRRWLQCL